MGRDEGDRRGAWRHCGAARRRRLGSRPLSTQDAGTAGPYLLDTHIWFWYLLQSEQLPAGLRAALEEKPDDLWLSPISVWELALLAERGRVRLANDSRAWITEALRRVPLHEAALTREVALVSIELDLPHRDPADCFLAATALVHGLTLMTVDVHLSGASWLSTRSA